MRPQKSASAISQNPKLVPDMISRSLTVRRLWLGLGARWLRMNVNNLFYARVVEAEMDVEVDADTYIFWFKVEALSP